MTQEVMPVNSEPLHRVSRDRHRVSRLRLRPSQRAAIVGDTSIAKSVGNRQMDEPVPPRRSQSANAGAAQDQCFEFV